MEQFSTQKVILVGILLLVLVVVTAFFQIKLRFDTLIALAIMLLGTVVAAYFLGGAQG
jgi:MFS-type transporter involved in bile tolerance (Atg22 family)